MRQKGKKHRRHPNNKIKNIMKLNNLEKRKKLLKKIVLLAFALSSFSLLHAFTYAQDIPEIYPTVVTTEGSASEKIELLTRLPGGDWRVILSRVITTILQITGSLTLISFTVGGVTMITAQGNEEKISKGKAIMLWSVVALVIIATAYAIVLGVTQLQFT